MAHLSARKFEREMELFRQRVGRLLEHEKELDLTEPSGGLLPKRKSRGGAVVDESALLRIMHEGPVVRVQDGRGILSYLHPREFFLDSSKQGPSMRERGH